MKTTERCVVKFVNRPRVCQDNLTFSGSMLTLRSREVLLNIVYLYCTRFWFSTPTNQCSRTQYITSNWLIFSLLCSPLYCQPECWNKIRNQLSEQSYAKMLVSWIYSGIYLSVSSPEISAVKVNIKNV